MIGLVWIFLASALAQNSAGPIAVDYGNFQTRKAASQFATCLIKRDPRTVEQYALGELNNTEFHKAYAKFMPECLNSVLLKLPADSMRYGIAEALYKKEFGTSAVLDFKSIAPTDHVRLYKQEGDYGRVSAQIEAMRLNSIAWSKIGECVVRREPARSASLVRAGLVDEKKEVVNLVAAFESCVIGERPTKLLASELRGTVALNLYRLSVQSQRAGARP